MDLSPFVGSLQHQLAVAADAGGDDARALAERLTAPLESAARLVLLEALAAAAGEITLELAPAAVEVRLRGRDPEFVVTGRGEEPAPQAARPAEETAAPLDGAESGMSRTTLRLPDHLKRRMEDVAARQGLSVNAWLIRTVTDAVEPDAPDRRPGRRPADQGFTGWVR